MKLTKLKKMRPTTTVTTSVNLDDNDVDFAEFVAAADIALGFRLASAEPQLDELFVALAEGALTL